MPIGYCCSILFVYIFFIKKAELVGKFERGPIYQWVSFLMFWGTLIAVPFVLLPLCAAFYGGVLTDELICIMVERQLWLAYFFIIANFGISVALLGLFVVPLRNNAKALSGQNPEVSKHMWHLAYYNARMTFLALCVTTCSVIFMIIAETLSNQDGPAYNYLMVVALAVIMCDMSFNGFTCKMMTNIWVPTYMRKKVHSHLSSNKSLSSRLHQVDHEPYGAQQESISISSPVLSSGASPRLRDN